MARVRQRLAINNDPGKTTQVVEKKILDDLDVLIEQSRRKVAQARNQPPNQGQGQPQPQPQPSGAQANNQGQQQPSRGSTPAGTDASSGGSSQVNADTSKDIRESQAEWGGLTPRQRAAVLEGGSENVVPDYAKMIDEYFKTLSKKGSEK
jgi:predicted lipid-binding transport protein (Tim44 family)